jgi:hypothetical protein
MEAAYKKLARFLQLNLKKISNKTGLDLVARSESDEEKKVL